MINLIYFINFSGILVNKQTNSNINATIKMTKLAVERFNKELRTINTTILQLEPVIEIIEDENPIKIIDSRKSKI